MASEATSVFPDLTDFDVAQADAFSELQNRYDVLGRIRELKARLDGSDWQQSVQAVSVANIADLAAGAPLVVGGATLEAGQFVLCAGQTDKKENLLYEVIAPGTGADGAWSPAEPMLPGDTDVQLGAKFFDEDTKKTYVLTAISASPAIVGTAEYTFTASDPSGILADLAATTNGKGAALIGIEDAGGYYGAGPLETVLTAIAAQLGGDTDATKAFTDQNVVADDDALYAAVDKLDIAMAPRVQFVSKQITTADLTAEALTEAVPFDGALPAKAEPLYGMVDVTTLFSGGASTSCTAEVGTSGDPNALVQALDVFTGASTGRQRKDGVGASLGGVTPEVLFTSDVDVDTLDAGDLTAWIAYVVNP